MTPEKQLTAIAELDGWSFDSLHESSSRIEDGKRVWYDENYPLTVPYLTSRDAIIPVIEKQSRNIQLDFIKYLHRMVKCNNTLFTDLHCVLATPSQLAEALLRATGKWED